MKRYIQNLIVWILTVCMFVQILGTIGFLNLKANAQEVTSSLQMSYLKNGTWHNFNKSSQSSMDGIKIQTSSSSSYYLQYRTWNENRSDYYPFVTSTENDYAGSSGKPIQRLQIQAYRNDGTKLVSGVVVMYRALVDGVWLPWVSNADPEWMESVQTKYNLGGTLDTSGSYAGISGKNIGGIEIWVFEESDLGGGSGGTSGTEVTHALSYLNNGVWTDFNKSVQSPMDGIKIQTSSGSSYYLQYRTFNQGQSSYYPYVKSNINDYAGSSGKPIQQLQIQAYKNDGTKLVSGVVVMYRASVDGVWLPWVSNADPEWMRSVQTKYNLGGTLDTSGSYAGISGKNISGIEIRVFEETDLGSGGSGQLAGDETAPSLSYLRGGSWNSFSKSVQTTMDGIRIQTSSSKSYYLKYRTWNQGQSSYYPYVTSIENDYAGSSGKPIQRLQIQAYKNDGTKLVSGVVVMYRALVDGIWLPWVSNADPEWMRSAQSKYNLGGTLDTSGSYAGISGKNISGIEIRVFEENNIGGTTDTTPTGKYKVIQAPHIYQMTNYPTGCESVSAVMALNYAGINTSVDTFIDAYLDRSSGVPFNPNLTFGGNPRSTSGYGCYAPVIKKALDKALGGTGYHAEILNNVSLDVLCNNYIDNNIPVITWATMNMAKPKNGPSWVYNGQTIQWIQPEHCLLLVGYDQNNYIFNDPQSTTPRKFYNKAAVETAYKGMHSQAVVIVKDSPATEIALNNTIIAPVVGETRQLTVINEAGSNITWTSNNDTVAKVSQSGLVTAKRVGTSIITAKHKSTGKTATCIVTVSPLKIYQSPNSVSYDKDGNLAEDLTYGDLSRSQLIDLWWPSPVDVDTSKEELVADWRKMCSDTFSKEPLTSVVNDMIDHFMDGTGTSYSNPVLTQKAKEHASTQKYVSDTQREISTLIQQYSGNVYALKYDYLDRDNNPLRKQFESNGVNEPVFNTAADKMNGLTICVNSLWGNYIEVTDYTVEGNTYSGTLKFTLYDHFGLDYADIDKITTGMWTGFRYWYVLQHYDLYEGQIKPFVTFMEFEVPFNGTIS